jgi:hypothetical protein
MWQRGPFACCRRAHVPAKYHNSRGWISLHVPVVSTCHKLVHVSAKIGRGTRYHRLSIIEDRERRLESITVDIALKHVSMFKMKFHMYLNFTYEYIWSTIERARLIRCNFLLVSSTHNLISQLYKHFLLFYGKHSHVLKLFLYSDVSHLN